MTYFGFLLRFLVIPILILLFINRRVRQLSTYDLNRRKVFRGIFIHVILAVVYTTPWDNYLVATGVWYYKPQLVSGYILGYVPIEEYTFFVLETFLAGSWWWFLAGRLSQPGEFKPSKKYRFTASLLLIIIWGIFVILFSSKVPSVTYLSIIMVWALPAILPQLLFGADILWHHRKLIFFTILPVSIYLSIIDALAISGGIWTIDPAQSTSIKIGALPMEEAVFFLMTNLLIGFGLTLLIVRESPMRLSEIRQTIGNAFVKSGRDQFTN
jgi:lycopene cyclase domain-containing protein